MPETMNLLGRNKIKMTEDKNGENVPHLEITELVLVHSNIVNLDHELDLRVLHIFIPDKLFGRLLDISLKNFVFLKTFNSEFSNIKVWFTDQNSKLLEIEDKKITLVIN